MTSKQARGVPAEVGRSFGPGRLGTGRSHSEKRPTDAAALRHVPVGDANARRPAPNPAGCPAWACSRHPRDWAWNATGWSGMTLAIDDPPVSVSLTDGMIAADFLRDPTGIRIGHALPNGPTAGSCGPFLFGCNSAQAARHLHGTKLAGAGRGAERR